MNLLRNEEDEPANRYRVAEWEKRPLANADANWISDSAIRAISVAIALALTLLAALSTQHVLASQVAALFLFLVFGVRMVWGYTGYRARIKDILRLGQLMDKPPHSCQFFVAIKLYSGLFSYGSDIGVLRVVDGWLVFDGLRTNFCVPAANLKKFQRAARLYRYLPFGFFSGQEVLGPIGKQVPATSGWRFMFSVEGEERCAKLWALDANAEDKMAEEIVAASANPGADGVTVLPPLFASPRKNRVPASTDRSGA